MARLLPDWIDSYLEYTDNTEPRKSYHLWVAISTIAAVLQRKCWFGLGSEYWFPNFYIILTGPPAARKGTAIKSGLQMMKSCGVVLAADEGSRQKLIGRLERCKAQYADAMKGFHSSLTIVASELTVFLKRSDEDMLSMLQKWFDCEDRYIYDTYAHDEQSIEKVWVNLLGATTPSLLQTTLPPEAFGAGLISRTLFVYEDNKEKIVVFPTLPEALGKKLEADLQEISALEGRFRVENSEEFLELYTQFRYETEELPPITDVRLEKYNDRRPMHLCKLCMIMSASRSNDMIITIDDFRRALTYLELMEQRMPFAFRGVGASPVAAIQAQIMGTVMMRGTITTRELMELYHTEINFQQLQDIIATLMIMGFCVKDKDIVRYNEAFGGKK